MSVRRAPEGYVILCPCGRTVARQKGARLHIAEAVRAELPPHEAPRLQCACGRIIIPVEARA